MKRNIVLILVCLTISPISFASKRYGTSIETTIDTMKTVKDMQTADPFNTCITDSLQVCADSLLQLFKADKSLVTPHLNSFMKWLMNSDTMAIHQEIAYKFANKLIIETRSLSPKNNVIRRQLIQYYESLGLILQVKQILSIPYNAKKIELAEKNLNILDKHELNPYLTEQLDELKRGVKYYKNKIAIRRIGDIIEELYTLRADTTLFKNDGSPKNEIRDSLFTEIISHQGRNHLINYVPYAASLRQKIVDSFPFDKDKHVLIENARWDVIETVRKEIESILKK